MDEVNQIKSAFSKNMLKLRKSNDLTQEEVANALGVTKGAVSEWESAKKLPNAGNLEKLASYFKIPKSALLAEEHDQIITYDKTINLPIVGKISCGNGSFAYEEIEGYEPTPADWLNGGEYFYTRAQGDSMINARIHDGDLLLIRRQPDVEDGEIAAVLIDEDIFLKRVFKRNGTVILQSENPAYPPIISNSNSCNNCMIIGKLKKVSFNM
ncbi:helix-turn-helix domain-containing protein|uniref:Repressor LexA n=1 Tax=Dendrosporobacter quercicolus TaxID=146817 RepID=A0A1G9ZXY5_9FIRM|nr:XRE family transcriptional regulator [Dendrosporobacter quercicolus]NSL49628.1 helix-turn-helix domain-containing protein [Dendrosporobacter quercicolus DSM 1736]SDN25543.1 repressor LexA [Dendrosporobacter quercicolus]